MIEGKNHITTDETNKKKERDNDITSLPYNSGKNIFLSALVNIDITNSTIEKSKALSKIISNYHPLDDHK